MDLLPTEVITQICEDMDLKTLSKFSQCNWRINQICFNNSIYRLHWKLKKVDRKCQSDLVEKYDNDIEQMFYINISNDLPLKDIKSYVNRIKYDEGKIRELAVMLNSLDWYYLLYSEYIKHIVYEISPDLYGDLWLEICLK